MACSNFNNPNCSFQTTKVLRVAHFLLAHNGYNLIHARFNEWIEFAVIVLRDLVRSFIKLRCSELHIMDTVVIRVCRTLVFAKNRKAGNSESGGAAILTQDRSAAYSFALCL